MQSIVRTPSQQQSQGKHGSYNAVDYIPTKEDPYYYAPEDGTVTLVDNTDDDSCGKRLKVRGATGEHGFCHNATIYVKVGQKVKRGQKLAKMGYTGYTQDAQGRDDTPEGTHVHWILNINGAWIYPPSKVNQSFIKLGDTDMYKGRFENKWINLSAHGWYDKAVHYRKRTQEEVAKNKSLTKQVAALKSQVGDTTEATLLGKALLPIIQKLGYKK